MLYGMPDLSAQAKRIIDDNVYMTLATADGEGRPWASPVWFAHDDLTRFVWVSKPGARHSRNLAVRPQVGIVIFDSTVGQGAAEGVYVEAKAEQLEGAEDERGIEIFNRRSEGLGWPSWSVADVREPARLRLYLATASALFLLGAGDERIPVDLG
jgi:nitroimidazol reductase NimA-like FMN-containing flavoprotein (pyridoxamine 5'-phosphate oxidase superfamily)